MSGVYPTKFLFILLVLGSKVNEIKDIVHSYFSLLSYGKGKKTDVCKQNLTHFSANINTGNI